MSSKPGCFVAYPSKPPSLSETIEEAIEQIKPSQVADVRGWKSTSVAGKFIISAICQAIDRAEVFWCDLTTLNHNVLFELGYAIAKKKRIWILLNPTLEGSEADYRKFKLLTAVGYASYKNSVEIKKAFYRDQPYASLENTIYRDAIQSLIYPAQKPMLLYLKSSIDTNASIKLSRRVEKSRISCIVDDPQEIGVQPLSWYAQKVHNACGVIAHLLSREQRGWRFHNAKIALVTGLAYGFGRHVLMLAHEPYESPIDYQDLLKPHSTAVQCERLADSWLSSVEGDFAQKRLATRKYEEKLRAHSELQNISIGDPIAEQESDALLRYFVRTAAYDEAAEGKNSVFVGRKGSGKTAIFYRLAYDIRSDSRNHLCIIKPVGYEVEGILAMLRQALGRSEQGYLIEAFWKFLIYTEVAKSVFEGLSSKPAYYERDQAESELVDFVEENDRLVTPDFSIRLESVVERLQAVSQLKTASAQRTRISELLHEKVIGRLRRILGNVLHRKQKVAVLMDNLDKAWKPREDLSILCDLLFGLIDVSFRISRDFRRSDSQLRPVNLSLIVFLRSDIFARVMKYAREKDKIMYSRIAWGDPAVLLRVLEQRFLSSTQVVSSPEEMWSRYFCSTIRGTPIKQYLVESILPRPRDLIYLSRTAISQAVNRGHTKVEEDDILEAQKKYSQYALDSIVVENSIEVEPLEALLYEFVGGPEIIDRNAVLSALGKAGIPDKKLDEVIELLCDLSFLGQEVKQDRFAFLDNEDEKAKLQIMARKTAEARPDCLQRFRINTPFHAYLEIKPSARASPSH